MRKLGIVVAACLLPCVAVGDAARTKAVVAAQKGDAAVDAGDLPAARKAFEEAVALDKAWAEAAEKLAYVDDQLGDDAAAAQVLEALTAQPGAPVEAWQMLGIVEAKVSAWAKAAAAYERYLDKTPADVATRLELARAYGQLATTDPGAKDKAQVVYARVIKDGAGNATLTKTAQEELFVVKYGAEGKLFSDGKNALVAGDYRGAIAKLEAVVGKHPEIEEAHFLLGMAYSAPEIGRRADAMRAWDRAPTVKEAQLHLAMALHDDGDLKNAEQRFKKALGLDDRYQEAWYHLGELYSERGDGDGAKDAWVHARNLDPQSPTGKWAQTRLGVETGDVRQAFEEGEVIDPATEIVLGRKIVEQILRQYPLVEDEKLQERLDRIWQKLVAVTDRGDIPYKLMVFQFPMPNGFTFPGGNVLIPSAMIDIIKTRLGDKDEYYAALLSHELAHAALRHTPEGLRFDQAKLSGNAAVNQMMKEYRTRATRQQEYEADKYGALYMYRAGYNPKYMLDFWRQAPRVFGGGNAAGQDHATHEERARIMRDDLIELRGRVGEFERGNEAMKDGEFEAAAQHYEVFLAVLPRSAPGRLNYAVALHRGALKRLGAEQKWKRSMDFEPDAHAAKIEVNASAPGGGGVDPRVNERMLKEALASYETALRLDPAYALARVDYGAILMDMGRAKQAVKVLEQATKMAPRWVAAWNNLGVAYAMAGEAKKAQQALETAAKLDDTVADPWFNLGVLYADGGKPEQAMKAYDEYAKRDASSGWAKEARARRAGLEAKKGK